MSRYGDWQAAHRGKRKFRTREEAWMVIARIWWRERHIDSLQPYVCRWGARWTDGQTAPPHIHIGHARYTPLQQARHLLRTRVIWPWFRARTRWRRLRRRLVR